MIINNYLYADYTALNEYENLRCRVTNHETNKFFIKKKQITIKIFKYYYTQIRWDVRHPDHELLYIYKIKFYNIYYYKVTTRPIYKKKLIILKNYFVL